MQWPSAGEWVAIIAIIVTAGLIAGIVVAWREEKKREREEKERRERWRREKPD